MQPQLCGKEGTLRCAQTPTTQSHNKESTTKSTTDLENKQLNEVNKTFNAFKSVASARNVTGSKPTFIFKLHVYNNYV